MNFHLYGFFIGLGILVAVEVCEKARKLLAISYKPACSPRDEAGRRGRPYAKFSVWKIFWWVMIPAIIGARLYHVLDFWEYYASFPQKIWATWEGGMGIWGGVIGGMIGLWGYAFWLSRGQFVLRKFSIFNFQFSIKIPNYQLPITNFLLLADLAVIGLPLGQAIGRIGNFFNQELYGWPTSLPWGIYIDPQNRLAGLEKFTHFHPLFAYEAVWDLIIFITVITIIKIILKARRRIFPPGLPFFTYLGLYGLGRFLLEFLRINPWRIGVLTVAQWLSLVAITLSTIYSTKVWILTKKP